MPNTMEFGNVIKKTVSLGSTGVDLFFVLSGFLIGGILLDHRKAPHYFKSFYVRRICRILPLYYLILLAYMAASRLLSSHTSQFWYQNLFTSGVPLWTHFIFLQTIFQVTTHGTGEILANWLIVTWTLALEEQFYLILPLAVRLVRPDWLLGMCVAVVFVHPLFYCFLWLDHPSAYWLAVLVAPTQADALVLGIICAWLIRKDWFQERLRTSRQALYALFLLFLFGAACLTPLINSPRYVVARDLFFFPALGIFYALLLLLSVAYRDGAVARVMRFRPLRLLGIISYGVYLLHMPVNDLLHGLVLGEPPLLESFGDVIIELLAVAITLVLASLSWRFFEKPIIAMGHSFRYGNRKTPGRTGREETTQFPAP